MSTSAVRTTDDSEWEVVSEPGDQGPQPTSTPPDAGGNEADTDFEDLGGDDVSMRSLVNVESIPDSTGTDAPHPVAPGAAPPSTTATDDEPDAVPCNLPRQSTAMSEPAIPTPESLPAAQTQVEVPRPSETDSHAQASAATAAPGNPRPETAERWEALDAAEAVEAEDGGYSDQLMEDEENDLAQALAEDADDQADRRAIAAIDAADAAAEAEAVARADEAGRWGGYLASCTAAYGNLPRRQDSLDGRLPHPPRPLPSIPSGPSTSTGTSASSSSPPHVPGSDLPRKSRSIFADTAQYAVNNIPSQLLDPDQRPYLARFRAQKQTHKRGRSSGDSTQPRDTSGPPGGLPHPPTRESRELLDQLRTRDGGSAGPNSPSTRTRDSPSSSPTSPTRHTRPITALSAACPQPVRRHPAPVIHTIEDEDDIRVTSSVARLTLPPSVLEAVHHSLLFDVQRWWTDALTAATESDEDDAVLASILLTDDELETFMPDIDIAAARMQWREQLNQIREPQTGVRADTWTSSAVARTVRPGGFNRLDSSDDEADGPEDEAWRASVLHAARSARYGGVGEAMPHAGSGQAASAPTADHV